jgi:hypothetical protein
MRAGHFSNTSPAPEAWVRALRNNGYRAAQMSAAPDADDSTVRAY